MSRQLVKSNTTEKFESIKIELNRSFNNANDMYRFLFILKTFLRCMLKDRNQRKEYFGQIRKEKQINEEKGIMSKILYVPEIYNTTIKSITVYLVTDNSEAFPFSENVVEQEVKKLFNSFNNYSELWNDFFTAKKEKGYITNKEFKDLAPFFKNCIQEKKRKKNDRRKRNV